MYELMTLFFRIAIFKQGPQDVPASPIVLRLMLPLYIGLNYVILWLNGSATPWLQIAADFAMMAAFTWPLLYFSAKPARFPQTFSAMVGTDCILSFLALPAIASLYSQPNELAYVAMLVLMVWHWVISAHILRNALDRSWFFGLGLALLYIMLSSQVMAALFPGITVNPE